MLITVVAIVVVLSLQVRASCALVGQDEICSNNNSWSVRKNDQQFGYQYTVTETSPNCLDTCQLKDNVQSPITEYAERVLEVNTYFYGSNDDNGDVITCLNITFEVNRHSASKLEGLIITLEDGWNGDYKGCFRLNFTTRLTSFSVFDSTTRSRNRLFYFDCFCDLKISDDGPNRYSLRIRSLPYQSENCILIDDQTVRLHVNVPGCRDPIRTWTDKYCQTKPEETWNPPIAISQSFPQYNTVRLIFVPAPPGYAITHYEIYIYSMINNVFHGYVEGQIINVDDLTLTPVNINGLDVNGVSFDYEVNANPGEAICVTIITWKGMDEVKSTDGPQIIFQANPCDASTCGPLGSCIPLGQDYFCQCQEGSLNLDNLTCIPNPCDISTCWPLGSCIPQGQDYFCQCQEGSLNLDNHTCIESNRDIGSSWEVITGAVVGAVLVVMIVAIFLCIYKKLSTGSDAVIFVYPEENWEFVHLAELLAILLKIHGGIRPLLPRQNILKMNEHDREVWFSRASARAKKILWICSPQITTSPYSHNFEKLLMITNGERKEMKEKHLVCFFSALSSRRDVPSPLRDLRTYSLLEDLDALWFDLKDIETHTIHYSMPNIPSAERTALISALENFSVHLHYELQSLINPDSGFRELEHENTDAAAMASAWKGLTTEHDVLDSDDQDSAYADYASGTNITNQPIQYRPICNQQF